MFSISPNKFQFSKMNNLEFSLLKELADDNFKFDENCRKFSKRVENTVTSNSSFSDGVFKRLVLQTHINKGLFGKEFSSHFSCFVQNVHAFILNSCHVVN